VNQAHRKEKRGILLSKEYIFSAHFFPDFGPDAQGNARVPLITGVILQEGVGFFLWTLFFVLIVLTAG